jgi:type IV pilus assembly protein PilM
MAFLDQLRGLVEDPPPVFAFEVSPGGIAYAVRGTKKHQAPDIRFQPFNQEILSVSPVKDNVLLPDVLHQQVAALAPTNGYARRRRDAALILPDYCARVAVLDFESFPSEKNEQLSLVRFRMKKTVPFDLDSAAISYQFRQEGKKYEVLVAAAQVEVIARYEAPFRMAGYVPGFSTTSILAAMDLMPSVGLNVAVKLAGRMLTVAVCEGRYPKLVRCVELESLTSEAVMAVLFPTLAYAEDELPHKPQCILTCGFSGETDISQWLSSGTNFSLSPAASDAVPSAEGFRKLCESELGLPVEPLQSLWGPPNESNAGLLGWLQAQEGKA